MMAKKRSRKDSIPQTVIETIGELIHGGAAQLDAEDTANTGYDTWDVVDRVEASARREAKGYDRIVFRDWIARQVPTVLGKTPEKRSVFWQPLLPDLVLPAWFSVPPEHDEKGRAAGPARWKRDRKTSPNELARVEDHLRKALVGRQTTLQKIVVVRETALRRGCDPDEPISTVLDDDDRTAGRPGDRPSLPL
jgi:hypothetical protein